MAIVKPGQWPWPSSSGHPVARAGCHRSVSSCCFLPLQVQGQPLMVQVSGGQLITSTGQPIMVQAVPGGQGQTIMQVPVSGTQGLQQVSQPPSYRTQIGENEPSRSRRADSAFAAALKRTGHGRLFSSRGPGRELRVRAVKGLGVFDSRVLRSGANL